MLRLFNFASFEFFLPSMRPDTHMQFVNKCLCPLLFCFFQDVGFSEYYVPFIAFSSLYGEYVVRLSSGYIVMFKEKSERIYTF